MKPFSLDKRLGISLEIFIPSHDQQQVALAPGLQARWMEHAMELLGRHLGGATAFPHAFGVWWSGSKFLWDHPVVVQAYCDLPSWEKAIEPVHDFLRHMGRSLNQAAVGFVLADEYFEIKGENL